MRLVSGAEIYHRAEIVDYFDGVSALYGAERLLFDRHVKAGSDILDLGVGTGRTTPYLARVASRYVGLDVSDAMVARCREKFPDLAFLHLDATNLPTIADASFDVVVFSFNGIDVISTIEARRR